MMPTNNKQNNQVVILILLMLLINFESNAATQANIVPASINSIVIQADNNIVGAGYAVENKVQKFLVARYTTSLALDTTFNTTGLRTTSIGTYDKANAVRLQSTNAIIAGGYATVSGVTRFAVARYTTAGALDTTFNSPNGYNTTAIGDGAQANAIAIQAAPNLDGIIMVGSAVVSGLSQVAVVRYTSAGALDGTFGSSGIVLQKVGNNSYATSVGLQTVGGNAGKIVVGGFSENRFMLLRYTTAGALDATFGTSGVTTTTIGSFSQIYGLTINSSDQIIVAGVSDNKFVVARYTSAGVLDTTFNSGGSQPGTNTTAIMDSAAARSVTIQTAASNEILVSGYAGTSFALARYTSAGVLDTTFNGSGIVVSPILTNSESLSVRVRSSGQIIAAGFAGDNATIVCYNSDGSFGSCTDNGVSYLPGDYVIPTPVTGRDYIYAYDTTTQSASATTGQFNNILFSTNGQLDGWTHTAGTANFVCARTGFYTIQFDAVGNASQAGLNISVRGQINAVSIAGSQGTMSMKNANSPLSFSHSFMASINAGDILTFQLAGDNANVSLMANVGFAAVRPSISVTIGRMR